MPEGIDYTPPEARGENGPRSEEHEIIAEDEREAALESETVEIVWTPELIQDSVQRFFRQLEAHELRLRLRDAIESAKQEKAEREALASRLDKEQSQQEFDEATPEEQVSQWRTTRTLELLTETREGAGAVDQFMTWMHDLPTVSERVALDNALERLMSLYDGWGLDSQTDWVLADEFAMLLQGYRVEGEELATRHLDTFVNMEKLPWEPQVAVRTRMTIPPRDSQQMEEYSAFMGETEFGLNIHQEEAAFFELPCEFYTLPSGRGVRLLKPIPNLQHFYENTLLRFTAEDVGESKIREWEAKLSLTRNAALEAGDPELADLATGYIQDWEAQKES